MSINMDTTTTDVIFRTNEENEIGTEEGTLSVMLNTLNKTSQHPRLDSWEGSRMTINERLSWLSEKSSKGIQVRDRCSKRNQIIIIAVIFVSLSIMGCALYFSINDSSLTEG